MRGKLFGRSVSCLHYHIKLPELKLTMGSGQSKGRATSNVKMNSDTGPELPHIRKISISKVDAITNKIGIY